MVDSAFEPNGLVVLVGPTGSGKSGLAADLCRRFPMEVVCMDSMQIYSGLSVGVAGPTKAELEIAPHHLFGAVPITERMTSVRYAEMAREVIGEIRGRGRIPLLVGGTGLYMRALFEDAGPLPQTPASLRNRVKVLLERKGLPRVYEILKRLDPRGAAHLHPNDRQRIVRFLEVRVLTGKSMLDHWAAQEKSSQKPPLTLGLQIERGRLWPRIEARTAKMLAAGWVDEARRIMEKNLTQAVIEAGPIGYALIFDFITGKIKHNQLLERIFIATRQYAKRQMTWFRGVPYIQWFPYDPISGYNVNAISNFVTANIG